MESTSAAERLLNCNIGSEKQMQPHLDALKAEIRASPAVQMDETGWREDGVNGYIWAVSTRTIRYYEYHHSRSGKVVKELIGENFGGILGSDFYAGYNIHQGLHQRCWVHYLRDVHDLKEKYPQDEQLLHLGQDRSKPFMMRQSPG